jgi:hypothetical protein
MNAVGHYSTDDELLRADADITGLLKSHLSNFERAWLVDDRRTIRTELALRAHDRLAAQLAASLEEGKA